MADPRLRCVVCGKRQTVPLAEASAWRTCSNKCRATYEQEERDDLALAYGLAIIASGIGAPELGDSMAKWDAFHALMDHQATVHRKVQAYISRQRGEPTTPVTPEVAP